MLSLVVKWVHPMYQRAAVETKCVCVSDRGRGEYGLNYLSDNDLSSLAVDAEGEMTRFAAKTLKVIVILMYCMGPGTEAGGKL